MVYYSYGNLRCQEKNGEQQKTRTPFVGSGSKGSELTENPLANGRLASELEA